MTEEKQSVLLVELIEPDRLNYRVDGADSVMVEAADGELTILPGHTSLLSVLRPGKCVTREKGEKRVFAVDGGLLEVRDDRVRILTRAVEESDDIDRERAGRARERAEKRLKRRSEDIELARAQASLYRATNRLEVLGELAGEGYN